MTPTEHETRALQMRVLAQKVLLDWLADAFRFRHALTSSAEQSAQLSAMRGKLQSMRSHYSSMTLPWLDAANSDLLTALFQEAFDEVSKEVLDKASAGLSAQEEARVRAALAALLQEPKPDTGQA